MIDDELLRTLFKVTIIFYACLVGASFCIKRETEDDFGQQIRSWPQWFRYSMGFVGILMVAGGCIGLGGLFVGWGPARFIFAVSILCKIGWTRILPVTGPMSRSDAFRREFETFLEGIIIATSFVATGSLFEELFIP